MDSNIQEDKNLYDDESIYFDLSEWISFFWSNKLVFIKVMTVALILGVIIALILPKKYTAIATILPPSSSSDISSRIRQITGSFSSGSSEIRLFPAIAKSRTVLEEVLKVNHNGKSFLNIIKKEHGVNLKDNDRIVKENILNFLKEQIDTQIDMKTSLVTIKVTVSDPEIAAALLNEILRQIDIFLRFRLKTSATAQSQMINKRLAAISDSLLLAEDNLLKFRESNRATGLSPKLQIFEIRLRREVEVNNAVYIELSRQLEIAKIQELQLKPVLNILDEAIPPIDRSSPHRKKIVLLFIFASLFLTLGYLKIKPLIIK